MITYGRHRVETHEVGFATSLLSSSPNTVLRFRSPLLGSSSGSKSGVSSVEGDFKSKRGRVLLSKTSVIDD